MVSYFAVFLCGFASWRENYHPKAHLTQRREGAKTRKAKPKTTQGRGRSADQRDCELRL